MQTRSLEAGGLDFQTATPFPDPGTAAINRAFLHAKRKQLAVVSMGGQRPAGLPERKNGNYFFEKIMLH